MIIRNPSRVRLRPSERPVRSMIWRRALAHAGVASFLFLQACSSEVPFDAKVLQPAFAEGAGPSVLFDEGHHNRHDIGGSYKPFAKLLKNDGFRLDGAKGPLTAEALSKANILVIVSAQPQTDTNDAPALSAEEVARIVGWVRRGGALLLVTDHYPFPNAVMNLAAALGLDVAKGMTLDAAHSRKGSGDDSRLIFSRENGLLGDHPIIRGRNPREAVRLVETFTGDAFKPRIAITPLLKLAPSAENRVGVPKVVRNGGDSSVTVDFVNPQSANGWVQGAAYQLGSGRVVALAEAAMITAQENKGVPIGMNAPGNDNRQFLLNTMRWLGRAL